MKEVCKYYLPLLLICSMLIHTLVSAATDSIKMSGSIRNGETLVSSGGVFELGFFSPGNSRNWYLGIWYYNMPNQTVVWVANREAPLTNNSAVLRVTKPGILSLLNETDGLIWSTNTSRTVQNPTARLLDSGNLVVKDADDDRPENFLWQSFHYPSDTSLPGMRLGWNFVTGVGNYLSSWRSNDDPAPGEFISVMDPSGYPQVFTKRGNDIRYRYGPWNGVQFSGAVDISSNDQIYRLTIRMNKNEIVYWEDVLQPSVVARITLDQQGNGGRWTWNDGTQTWNMYSRLPVDTCDTYNMCGAHGICNVSNSPPCGCLDRFVQKDPENWSRTDWSGGCHRRAPLNCRDDVFLKYSGLKLPDSSNSSVNDGRMSLADCQAECSRNCTCTAYTRLNISREGTGCLFYYGDLLDMRTVSAAGQDLYIRMSSTESESEGKKQTILIASFASVAGIVLCLIIIIILFYTKRMKSINRRKEGLPNASRSKEAGLPFFDLSTILKATNHFSMANKLGEGGFGPVYRGMLEDEQEIAVKCLAKNSSQGVDQLKNELMLIAKLQHRNLVRLLGGCIEREENMLIYEYMPNSSLNLIIFDQFKSRLLDWGKRFNIINGIAKGLLYLHQDSRLRIIHRDLKASNILLDADMNPKISDFGLARSFGGNETEAQTRRVVGTYGYMSPEYAIDGVFSIKSDVFSFGVLVLEIVSGKRNRGFSLKDHNLNLVGHAWTLYKEAKTSELVDTSLRGSLDLTQALRSIHVALLCVQKSPEDRPSMSSVVFMLGNEVSLPQAKEPGFFTERDFGITNKSHSSNATNSENQVTISLLQGR